MLQYSLICFYTLKRHTFVKGSHNKDRKLAQAFNSSFRCINDVLSLHNSPFGDYLHHIFPSELDVKDNTDAQRFASFLDLHFEINHGGRLKPTLRQTWWLHFPIVSFRSYIAICRQHQRMGFAFHNSSVIKSLFFLFLLVVFHLRLASDYPSCIFKHFVF